MKSINEMSGVEKAAALMVALGPDVASDIVKHLDDDSIKKITVEIAKIDRLSVEEKEELIGEFLLDIRKNKGAVYGGENIARDLLVNAFGDEKAKDLLGSLSKKDLERGFNFLNEIDTEILVSFLQNEHPQTITVTMAYLPPSKSAEILKSLPPSIAKDAAKRLAKMEKTSPEAVLEIARVLRQKYDKYKSTNQSLEATGGVDTLASIMSYISGDQERILMDHLERTLPDISIQIREKMFIFELVLNLSNREMRMLIDEIKDDIMIARALKGAGDEIRSKFLKNMSRNRAANLLNDIDAIGPVKVSEIQASRDYVVSVMKRLNEEGTITVRKEKELFIE
jgi:flagellar motor switch protein FliG